MTRKIDKYANRRGVNSRRAGPTFDPDLPVAGHYRIKLVRDGPPVALAIWFGAPLDPVTLDPLDRAPAWFAQVNGGPPQPASWYWPECARQPISQAEHDRIVNRSATLDPTSPWYDPLRPIDRLKTPVPF